MFCSRLLIALASGCSGVAAGRGRGTQVAFRCKVGCAYAEVVVTATLISVKRGSNSPPSWQRLLPGFVLEGNKWQRPLVGLLLVLQK